MLTPLSLYRRDREFFDALKLEPEIFGDWQVDDKTANYAQIVAFLEVPDKFVVGFFAVGFCEIEIFVLGGINAIFPLF